jgi:uncharacterized protein YndB with AHSA1/START domain
MATIHVERTIAAPPDEVFAWLADSSNYTKAPLAMREKRTKDGQGAPYGVGAIREITGAGAWFREEITAYDAPREFSYLIVKSFPPLKHKGGTVKVTPAAGGSHVSWKTEYTMSPALLDRLTAPLLKVSFNGILDACEKSLAAVRR